MRITRKNRAFTLVELMIVVAIIGVLAALAIFGVRKYILNAKTAEARNTVGGIVRGAQMAYDREIMPGAVLAIGGTAAFANQLCLQALNTVPNAPGLIQGKKYQSDSAEWGGTTSVGWTCLKFSMQDPQYFMYSYLSNAKANTPGAVGDKFSVIANGDLDGNTVLSTFQMDANVVAGTDGALVIAVAPTIAETNPNE